MSDLILRFMVLSYVPTILIWLSDTLTRMDNGEEMLFDKLINWIQQKLDIYYEQD